MSLRDDATPNRLANISTERLADAQAGAPQHDDPPTQATAVDTVARAAHHGPIYWMRADLRGSAFPCCAAAGRRGIPAAWPVTTAAGGIEQQLGHDSSLRVRQHRTFRRTGRDHPADPRTPKKVPTNSAMNDGGRIGRKAFAGAARAHPSPHARRRAGSPQAGELRSSQSTIFENEHLRLILPSVN